MLTLLLAVGSVTSFSSDLPRVNQLNGHSIVSKHCLSHCGWWQAALQAQSVTICFSAFAIEAQIVTGFIAGRQISKSVN